MTKPSDVKEVGEVVAVLNKTQMLIRSSVVLHAEQHLLVFQRLSSVHLPHDVDLDHVDIPKGTIEIQLRQEGEFYVARIFRSYETRRQPRISTFAQMLGVTDEVEVKVPGQWSGKLDETIALGIAAEPTITKGDLIATDWNWNG